MAPDMEKSEVGIKICGITTREDGVMARAQGADYLGLILSQGFPRSILPEEAIEIGLVAEAPLVAVLVDESVDEAERIAGLAGASVISCTVRRVRSMSRSCAGGESGTSGRLFGFETPQM